MNTRRVHAALPATRVISQVAPAFAARLGLGPGQRSLALVTATIDDVLYVALDEATKAAQVDVVYARSMYAGAEHAAGPFSGEAFGILAGPDPEQTTAGLRACVACATGSAWFEEAEGATGPTFFAHPVSQSGAYLSKEAGVARGTPLAYLVAPPLEAAYAVDQALKAAAVELAVWFEPPTETNFSGALLTGDQSAVVAACSAFRDAVLDIVHRPHEELA